MITQDRLREVMNYDPDTGLLTWRKPTSNRVKASAVAGTYANGYVGVQVDGKRYGSHILAFIYMEGYLPDMEIHHVDGIRDNNRWANLTRLSGSDHRALHALDVTLRDCNSSGRTGVHWLEDCKKWRAEMKVKGKSIHLGVYREKDHAIIARKVAETLRRALDV